MAKTSTVIVSTHILQEVQAICDRVLIIKDGRLALDSRLNELQKNARLIVSTDRKSSTAIPLFTSIANIASAVHRSTTASQSGLHTYELLLATESEKHQTAAAIAKTINNKGWQLFSMQFEARNLETIFADISA